MSQIAHIDTPTREQWLEIWQSCDHGTFFHSPYWAELWQRLSGARTTSVPERVSFRDGRQAIVPLCFESKFKGLLSRFVASPQATYGGWIAAQPLSLSHVEQLLCHLLDRNAGSLVWRMNPYDQLAFEAGARRGLTCRADVTHALDLSPGAEALLREFKNGYRADIQKAHKAGRVSVELATTLAEWRAYYRVYQETLGRWGHSAEEGYPWELFELLFQLDERYVKLWLGRHDGAIVSGELCLYAKRHVVSWHAATLSDYLRTNVAKVQIYEVIRDACARGYAWFDFNPSAGLAGVRKFKESFDARPLPAPVVYVDSGFKRLVRGVATNLDIPYARLDLVPLESILRASELAANDAPPTPRSHVRLGPAQPGSSAEGPAPKLENKAGRRPAP